MQILVIVYHISNALVQSALPMYHAHMPEGFWHHACCRDYLQALVAYLASFYARTQPLAPLDKQMAKVRCYQRIW